MLVFWPEKLVFLAVPKTGTTSLEAALAPRAAVVVRDPPILKHSPAYRYKRFVAPFLQKAGPATLETMAVVRHPISWLGSWYRYRRRAELEGHPNSTAGISFDAFVEEYTKDTPASFANVGNPAKFVSDGNGGTGVDHLFQYEQMDRVLAFLEDRLGTELTLPRHNVSPPEPLKLSRDTRHLLERKRADFFQTWEAARRDG